MKREIFSILKKMQFSRFEIEVYRKVCSIPWGHTRSYDWVADGIKSERGARAVGRALNKNPFPIIIPCHRVIRKDGSSGGFSCGEGLKKRLLELEKAVIMRQKDG